jgi:cell division protein ZipA
MRDWLTVIIVILIVVILVDGVRRMRLARRDKIHMSRSVYKSQSTREDSSKADPFTSELPNGGARVIGQRDPSYKPKTVVKPQARDQRKPQQTSLNLDEAVPMLMESVTDDVLLKKDADEKPQNKNPLRSPIPARPVVPQTAVGGQRIEPTISAEEPQTAEHNDGYGHDCNHPDDARDSAPANAYDDDDADYADEEDASPVYAKKSEEYEDEEGFGGEDLDGEDFDDEDLEDEQGFDDDDYDEYEDDYEAEELAPLQPVSERQAAEPEEVLIINVMATHGNNFRGEELLDVLLKCGMRFGDMDIFHRYSDSKGDGALLFSLANMVKPGTFDLDAMDEFDTPGVSLFMTLPLKADSMQSFELMADTARTIAETVGGELKDEQRSVMTRQTIEHCRERIRDFERRRLFSRQR